MQNIFWTGYSNNNRNAAIHSVQTVVAKFGDIVDFKFFSDISMTIMIEIKEVNIDNLYHELSECIGMEKHDYLHSSSQKERTIFLHITFSNGRGNMTVKTPSVPG
jgi:hypothetical protein